MFTGVVEKFLSIGGTFLDAVNRGAVNLGFTVKTENFQNVNYLARVEGELGDPSQKK